MAAQDFFYPAMRVAMRRGRDDERNPAYLSRTLSERWEKLKHESRQESSDLQDFVLMLMTIAHDSSEHALAGINPIEYLLDTKKRKEWHIYLREMKRRLHQAVISGPINQSDQVVDDFRNLRTLYREDKVGIKALWCSFEWNIKYKLSKLTPDLIIELMDRHKELDVFIRDWEAAVNGAPPYYEREYKVIYFEIYVLILYYLL